MKKVHFTEVEVESPEASGVYVEPWEKDEQWLLNYSTTGAGSYGVLPHSRVTVGDKNVVYITYKYFGGSLFFKIGSQVVKADLKLTL